MKKNFCASFSQLCLLHNLTIIKADDAVSIAGVVLRVRNHDDGGSLLVQLAEQVHHLLAVLGIQIACWLVGKDDSGLRHYGASHSHPLLLTS